MIVPNTKQQALIMSEQTSEQTEKRDSIFKVMQMSDKNQLIATNVRF
jgi:hypothetical protein